MVNVQDIERKTAQLWERNYNYRKLLRQTQYFIADALHKVSRPYIACSFGKDSSVMLHLIMQENPNISVAFVEYPETCLLDNYEEVIGSWKCKNLHRIFINADIEASVNEKDILPAWAIKNGFDAAFVGIRKEESKGRRITLRMLGKMYTAKNGQTRICPLSDWTLKDIAAYTYVNDIPLLNTYKQHGIMQRTTTGLADDIYGFREAQLLRLKQADITKYNLLLNQYQNLARYA